MLDYSLNNQNLHQPIKYVATTWYDDEHNRLDSAEQRLITTTVGRVIFNGILPEENQFVNRVLDKGGVKNLIGEIYEYAGAEKTTLVVDDIKDIGFNYAMVSGSTIAVGDISIPPIKADILQDSQQTRDKINRSYRRGLLTEQERDDRTIEIWQRTTKEIEKAVRENMDPIGNLFTMASSGSTKGGFGTIGQLAGMRGLMADPSGRIILFANSIEFPRRFDRFRIFYFHPWLSKRSGGYCTSYS